MRIDFDYLCRITANLSGIPVRVYRGEDGFPRKKAAIEAAFLRGNPFLSKETDCRSPLRGFARTDLGILQQPHDLETRTSARGRFAMTATDFGDSLKRTAGGSPFSVILPPCFFALIREASC